MGEDNHITILTSIINMVRNQGTGVDLSKEYNLKELKLEVFFDEMYTYILYNTGVECLMLLKADIPSFDHTDFDCRMKVYNMCKWVSDVKV